MRTLALAAGPGSEGLARFGELGLAFVLCALIGLERELRLKAAGLRTHTIVGIGAALFTIVSKWGFFDVLGADIRLDPSRIAASIVAGIGFIGGGLIFVRRDAVRGLTTAAAVWLTAAVGTASGAGLPVLAVATTAGYFLVVFGLTPIAERLPRSRHAPVQLRLTYVDGRGVLRRVIQECTDLGFAIVEVSTERSHQPPDGGDQRDTQRERESPERERSPRLVSVVLSLRGAASLSELAAILSDLPDMVAVSIGRPDERGD